MTKIITWPESQKYQFAPNFDEHASLLNDQQYGPCAYAVEDEYLEAIDNGVLREYFEKNDEEYDKEELKEFEG